MSIEDRLKDLIKLEYKSMLAFSEAIKLPYATIDSIFKRGFLNSGARNVLAICKFLKISADALADGEIVPYENSKMKIAPDELEMIRKYRALDERGKRAVVETLEREYSYVQPFVEESHVAT